MSDLSVDMVDFNRLARATARLAEQQLELANLVAKVMERIERIEEIIFLSDNEDGEVSH